MCPSHALLTLQLLLCVCVHGVSILALSCVVHAWAHRYLDNTGAGGDDTDAQQQQQKGAAFGFDYSQLQPAQQQPGGLFGASAGADDEPAAAAAAGEAASPPYRPPFASIPWQLSTNLPHDHLTHQVGGCSRLQGCWGGGRRRVTKHVVCCSPSSAVLSLSCLNCHLLHLPPHHPCCVAGWLAVPSVPCVSVCFPPSFNNRSSPRPPSLCAATGLLLRSS